MNYYILDCTLRDGGYYNSWNFPEDVVNNYLEAMSQVGVDFVELGLRSFINKGFKGASAYTSDDYICSLAIPDKLKVGVMINAAELVGSVSMESKLEKLFPQDAANSPVDLVRIACHVHEFEEALPASNWLKRRGYLVGFNLMQVADRTQEEVEALAKAASGYDIDALYFADSMGSMDAEKCVSVVQWLRAGWSGALGIHTHDNMGMALQNTLASAENGVTWLDSTVTGMGRGPGNARTEELVIEISHRRRSRINMVPLMTIIREYFQPLKNECGWGSNPYYFLSGKYGIHPTYVQEMLSDTRFSEEDILAAIEHLKEEGGKKFCSDSLNATRSFREGSGEGEWLPSSMIEGRPILILGAGPSVREHRKAIESFISKYNPVVIALNTQSNISQDLINLRVASHPVRLLADCETHVKLPQPLVTPMSRLPEDVVALLEGKEIYNFGLEVSDSEISIGESSAVLPNSLVITYSLAIAVSGQASDIFIAGFDGFGSGDSRTLEVQEIFNSFKENTGIEVVSVTNSTYDINVKSVYGM